VEGWPTDLRTRENGRFRLDSSDIQKEKAFFAHSNGFNRIPTQMRLLSMENWSHRTLLNVIDCLYKVKLVSLKTLEKKIRGLCTGGRAYVSLIRLQSIQPKTYREYLT